METTRPETAWAETTKSATPTLVTNQQSHATASVVNGLYRFEQQQQPSTLSANSSNNLLNGMVNTFNTIATSATAAFPLLLQSLESKFSRQSQHQSPLAATITELSETKTAELKKDKPVNGVNGDGEKHNHKKLANGQHHLSNHNQQHKRRLSKHSLHSIKNKGAKRNIVRSLAKFTNGTFAAKQKAKLLSAGHRAHHQKHLQQSKQNIGDKYLNGTEQLLDSLNQLSACKKATLVNGSSGPPLGHNNAHPNSIALPRPECALMTTQLATSILATNGLNNNGKHESSNPTNNSGLTLLPSVSPLPATTAPQTVDGNDRMGSNRLQQHQFCSSTNTATTTSAITVCSSSSKITSLMSNKHSNHHHHQPRRPTLLCEQSATSTIVIANQIKSTACDSETNANVLSDVLSEDMSSHHTNGITPLSSPSLSSSTSSLSLSSQTTTLSPLTSVHKSPPAALMTSPKNYKFFKERAKDKNNQANVTISSTSSISLGTNIAKQSGSKNVPTKMKAKAMKKKTALPVVSNGCKSIKAKAKDTNKKICAAAVCNARTSEKKSKKRLSEQKESIEPLELQRKTSTDMDNVIDTNSVTLTGLCCTPKVINYKQCDIDGHIIQEFNNFSDLKVCRLFN